jgi:hypothetical protein
MVLVKVLKRTGIRMLPPVGTCFFILALRYKWELWIFMSVIVMSVNGYLRFVDVWRSVIGGRAVKKE